MTKLLLHAGMAKTGTRTIQVNLSGYNWKSIPGAERIRYLNDPCITNNHSRYLHALCGEPRWNSAEVNDRSVNLFASAIDGAIDSARSDSEPYRSILISAESVSPIALDAKKLKLLESFISRYFSLVRVIVYVREPLAYICSRIQQDLKSAYPLEDSVVENAIRSADCTVFLSNLQRAFGDANVTIRSYDPGLLIGGDIVEDFCRGALVLPDSQQLRQQCRNRISSNFSAPPELIEILMQLYEQKRITPDRIDDVQRFIQKLNEVQWKSDTRFTIDFFSPVIRQRILKAARRLRTRARNYLGYDCFPSYQPIEHDPAKDFYSRQYGVKIFHYISTILEKLLIESGGYQTSMDIEQNGDKVGRYDETREEAKLRAFQLLESFYEQCEQRQS